MKAFFRTLLAVIIGIFLTGFLFFGIMAGIMAAALSGSSKDEGIKSQSVLRLKLSTVLSDRGEAQSFNSMNILSLMNGLPSKPLALREAVDAIKYAATDDRIKGIVIDVDGMAFGMSMAEEIREALQTFRDSADKFVYAYGVSVGQRDYALSSVADSVFLHPAGELSWMGLSSKLLYYKDAFARFGIEPQIIRHGKYKSAVEPFLASEMSPANREQMMGTLSSTWGYMQRVVTDRRQVTSEQLDKFANELISLSPAEAYAAHLVDSLLYEDEFDALLRSRLGLDSTKDIHSVGWTRYAEEAKVKQKLDLKAPRIALLYAEGEITRGNDLDNGIQGAAYAKEIEKLRRDTTIKAVVLRVNSPGGDATAAEQIWRALNRLREEKPLIVSMGQYAASGGYYISAPAHVIVSNETTLTGSIGVFGLWMTFGKLLRERLSISPQVVVTHQFSDVMSPFRAMKPTEQARIQRQVEDVYEIFCRRVSQGRNMTMEGVDSIGQGRVWSGKNALEIGLVDEIGDLNRALEIAAEQAGLSAYRLSIFPKVEKSPFDQLIRSFLSSKLPEQLNLSTLTSEYEQIEALMNRQGIRMEMPYMLDIR